LLIWDWEGCEREMTAFTAMGRERSYGEVMETDIMTAIQR
jgi:hypothetical protein